MIVKLLSPLRHEHHQITAIRSDGTLLTGELHATEAPDNSLKRTHSVKISLPEVGEFEASSYDILDCLDQVRSVLDPMGVLLCINACRLDSFVSGMARDMGRGFVVYLTVPGPDPKLRTVVQSLDPAPPGSVVTLEKQRAHRKALIESLRRPRTTDERA